MPSQLRTVLPIWGFAALAAVAIGVFVPVADAVGWLPIALAVTVLLTFIMQIAFVQQHLLVNRIMLSIGGAIAIFAAASGVLWLVAAVGR